MELTYRLADIGDISILCALRKKQLIDEGLEASVNIDEELFAFFQKHFFDHSLVEWVVETDSEIIATAAVVFYDFPPSYTNQSGVKGYITNMYTAPDFRGRGIASKLLDKLVDEAKKRNVSSLLLMASKFGYPVYRKYGFVEADEWLILPLDDQKNFSVC